MRIRHIKKYRIWNHSIENVAKAVVISISLVTGLFIVLFNITGCSDSPYTGSMLTPEDVDRYLFAPDAETLCLTNGVDSRCVTLVPKGRDPRLPIIHIYPTKVTYVFYHGGVPVVRAERPIEGTETEQGGTGNGSGGSGVGPRDDNNGGGNNGGNGKDGNGGGGDGNGGGGDGNGGGGDGNGGGGDGNGGGGDGNGGGGDGNGGGGDGNGGGGDGNGGGGDGNGGGGDGNGGAGDGNGGGGDGNGGGGDGNGGGGDGNGGGGDGNGGGGDGNGGGGDGNGGGGDGNGGGGDGNGGGGDGNGGGGDGNGGGGDGNGGGGDGNGGGGDGNGGGGDGNGGGGDGNGGGGDGNGGGGDGNGGGGDGNGGGGDGNGGGGDGNGGGGDGNGGGGDGNGGGGNGGTDTPVINPSGHNPPDNVLSHLVYGHADDDPAHRYGDGWVVWIFYPHNYVEQGHPRGLGDNPLDPQTGPGTVNQPYGFSFSVDGGDVSSFSQTIGGCTDTDNDNRDDWKDTPCSASGSDYSVQFFAKSSAEKITITIVWSHGMYAGQTQKFNIMKEVSMKDYTDPDQDPGHSNQNRWD